MKKPKITVITSLYNCAQYLEGYFKHVTSIEHADEIEILLLHNAPTEDELRIIQHYLSLCPFLNHYIIKELEGLYVTWNRGISLAQGEYITIWNVDDIRFPLSTHQQAETLDKNPEADISYGDFYFMYNYGNSSNDLKYNNDFKNNPNSFLRTHQIGCFPMWRKTIHSRIGYFDEQFKLVADFDFQIRAAINNCKFVKTEQILGSYLALVPSKLSSNHRIHKKELDVIYLRYGIYDYLNWVYWIDSLKYNISAIYNYDKPQPLSLYFKNRKKFIRKRAHLFILSTIKQPRYFLSYLKHFVFK